MKHLLTASALFMSLVHPTAMAQEAPSPAAIAAAAPAHDWQPISAQDLLVMTLAPDRDGHTRTVTIQLMPPPFSEPWVDNIRTLARAGWYDEVSINRVQDNYVVQWGDPDGEEEAKAKPLPEGLRPTEESDYAAVPIENLDVKIRQALARGILNRESHDRAELMEAGPEGRMASFWMRQFRSDPYALANLFYRGWPIAMMFGEKEIWPVHCYGMVGVGRGMSPDAGSGAELYTVIGHAPRHLDRNIALVGRVIEGIEHLSSLPRGTGDLGFYEDSAEHVPIRSVRIAADLPEGERPAFEYLSTESDSFANYADARANRREPFFIKPAGGADICNVPVPVRRAGAD
ncbi:peptidylprolyl isomerase [Altererythrobacter sp. SALINAS58]|uniref:peptidylprolyl isomerase n=1 Tax=Alteripontixanthobacter muriae TaxID=2705546 RepID=UPI0015752AE2|nr:peptidylprolyl isomerase [Alteripontixanthobacter muriae]NTZ42566.1 peptidylprolyl isomerase [Alteripontixanthobacter muriae]